MSDKILETIYEKERERLLSLSSSTLTGEYTSPVFGEGKINAQLMFIGEAPGKDETKLSRPFVGKAGKQLDEILKAVQIDRKTAFVTNSVKYRPTRIKRTVANRTPAKNEIKESAECLKREIELVQPRIIATLGNSPLYAVSHIFSLGNLLIGNVHGAPIKIDDETVLFPLYHPASVIYNRSLIDTLKSDMTKLAELLKT